MIMSEIRLIRQPRGQHMSTSLRRTGITYNGEAELSRPGKRIPNVSCKLSQFEEYITIQEAGTRSPLTGRSGVTRWCGEVISPVDLELEGSSFTLHFQEGSLPDAQVVFNDGKPQNNGTWIFNLAC